MHLVLSFQTTYDNTLSFHMITPLFVTFCGWSHYQHNRYYNCNNQSHYDHDNKFINLNPWSLSLHWSISSHSLHEWNITRQVWWFFIIFSNIRGMKSSYLSYSFNNIITLRVILRYNVWKLFHPFSCKQTSFHIISIEK